jgi:FlgN protein
MSSPSFRPLLSAVKDECDLLEQYQRLMDEEQLLVTQLKSEQVMDAVARRMDLGDKLAEVQEKRSAAMKSLESETNEKLSSMIGRISDPRERKQAEALVKRLRKVTKLTRLKAREFGQVVDFSLGLLAGSISVISSAARPKTRSYGSDGKIREKSVPVSSRAEFSLKEV